MNVFKLFDLATSERPTALALANAISIQPILTTSQQAALTAFEEESWFNGRNKCQARHLLEGALVAYQHGFGRQVQLYQQAYTNLVWDDTTERARDLLDTELNYTAHVYTLPDTLPLPTRSFSVPVEAASSASPQYEWLYLPLGEFDRLIPPHALKALTLLEQAGVAPMAYWVADKVQVRARLSVDPLLVVQLGRNFCSVAEWV